MSTPDYTLRQAVGIYQLAIEQFFTHLKACPTYNWFHGDYCTECQSQAAVLLKCRVRIRQCAEREGVKIKVEGSRKETP